MQKKRYVCQMLIYTSSIFLLLLVINACFLREREVDFNSEIKPIINRKCISCHGGVKAKGGFSLLFKEEAFANTSSGKPAIIPGDPDHSEMIRRLTLQDPEERMPYKHEPLTKEEIDVLREWVRQGAHWGQHWAYVPVAAPHVPSTNNPWVRNDVDRYIVAKLKEQGLEAAAEAPAPDLLRRVSLDLIGMYPSDAIARQYLENKDPQAYETLVDALLASPHFGEKWASMWLDLARYADTKGYERDGPRSIWRYRDWLIHAFNADMPYDRFLTEQLAGDLLPNPTDAQYIATAFHRNTMTNDEGGTDNEEFRTAAVLDRVNTTWQALMGTTFACTQCHSHPYDPFHHEEYYRFMAYFNDTRDVDSYADYPLLRSFNDSDRIRLDTLTSWVQRHAGIQSATTINKLIRTWQPSINSLTADDFVNGELDDTKWLVLRQAGSARLRAVELGGERDLLIFRWRAVVPGGVWEIHVDSLKGGTIAKVPVTPAKQWTIASVELPKLAGTHAIYLAYRNPNLTKPDQTGIEFDWFCFTSRFPGEGSPGYQENKNLFWDLLTKDVPTTPVMMDNAEDMHRASNVFERGNWLVKGQIVTPGVPASLKFCMPAGAPDNRLGLSMWMTSPQNPLVSRTMVNRIWEQLFGTGIVETLEDMGTQGSPPTHRELLDYLSYRFMNEDAWSLKRLLKEIVMSATYREDSRATALSVKGDPMDRYFSRGVRLRLSAEQVRDQDLCICGKLCTQLYGPSVFPYQPNGIWMSPWNHMDWVVSADSAQYRRALYTYWKRTASYPSMLSFDATSREVCTARRIRTNTPLQALVTLNDSVYLDMARHFARLIDSLQPGDPAGQIACGYRRMMYKPISPEKLAALRGLYQDALRRFTRTQAKAEEMLGNDTTTVIQTNYKTGVSSTPERCRLAALTVVANALLNLDEVITKN
jgi:hypothetical protein